MTFFVTLEPTFAQLYYLLLLKITTSKYKPQSEMQLVL